MFNKGNMWNRRTGSTTKYIQYIPRVPQCLSHRPNWGPPNPYPACECLPPLTPRGGGGAHSPADEGWGGSQFWRLEKKPSTLSTLWVEPGGLDSTGIMLICLDYLSESYVPADGQVEPKQVLHPEQFYVKKHSRSHLCWSWIHERTMSLRFLGLILRVLRLEVFVYNVCITNQFQATFFEGGRGSKIP